MSISFRLPIVRLLATSVVVACLTACASSTPAPDLPPTPASFRETDARAGVDASANPSIAAESHADWWMVFADPLLDRLIAGASIRNTTIQQAAARLAQARALAHGADANRMPQLGINGGASRQGGPLINAAGSNGTLINLATTFSYEVDLVGRMSKAAEAAALDTQTREAMLRGARLLMQAEIAQTYFSLRALDDERALVRSTAASYRETLALVERRRRAGFASDQAVARIRAEASATDAEAIALDRRRAELEHALAFLTGEVASTSSIEVGEWNVALPSIPPGIPGAVLARRPDVQAAERAMQVARIRLGIARTAWFPTLSLTGSGGYASSDLGELLRSSARSWGIAGLLAMTLFDGGRREAGIEGAGADLELAYAIYREQILVAFRDVEDQLSALRLLTDQAEALRITVDAAARAAAQSESLYRNGLVGQLDLLDARRTELRDRRNAMQVRTARVLATVGLVRALGGGWNGADASDASPRAARTGATAS